METGLRDAVVLVTGGAGGIGEAVCRAFAGEGARVVVHFHSSLLGRLDVCVANAGAYPPEDMPLWDLPLDRWEETLRSNLTATFLTARAFLRHAAATRSGSLVLVGSTAGTFGEAGHADYAAAKGAISSGLLLSLKNEAARIGNGVRVNAVAPGWVATPRRVEAGIAPDVVETATSTMSLKKLATPGDVAAQIVALASDRISGHLSGQVITVAGGMEGRQIPSSSPPTG